jgi:putative ABC transport system substrate-binding protein
MRRREFTRLLSGATVAWTVAAHAQQTGRVRRIGILTSSAENDPEGQSSIAAFREELRKLGWTEGRNIAIDIRWAAADVEAMKRFAEDLATLQPDLILTSSTAAAAAMLQQTRTIPVIFVIVADPVGSGFVASLPRPGGNATGFTPIVKSLGGKWVEILKEIAPRLSRVALLFNPTTATFIESYLEPFKAAAASVGAEAIIAPVNDMRDLEPLVAAEARTSNSGLVVIPDAFTTRHRAELIALATRYRVPAVYWSRSYTEAGGLISYGPFIADEYRRAAAYADRVLKGSRPSELPVQAPVKFELVVNLKTAKALGLDVPPSLLAAADAMID